MNIRDPIKVHFDNTKTNERKEITLASLETGPNHHNNHFLQMWIALRFILENHLLDYDFEQDLLTVGTPDHKWQLDTVSNDNGDMNLRKIVEVFVVHFYADKQS